MSLPPLLAFTAAAFLLILTLLDFSRGGRKAQKTLFLVSIVIFLAMELFKGLILVADTPAEVFRGFRLLLAAWILFPGAALPFFSCFGRKDDSMIVMARVPQIITLGILLVVAAIIVPPQLVISRIHITEGGPFWGMNFTAYGKGIGVYLLVTNILYLYLFENTYRYAAIPGKVTFKYPMLGLLAYSILNFIVTSRILAIATLDRNYMALQSGGAIMLALSFIYASVRYNLFEVQTYIGREVVRSVITLIVSGLFMISLAVISIISAAMGMPFDRLTFAMLAIFAAFLVLAVMISGNARRRLRRFVGENFYPDRFDYRTEWRNFSRLMASSRQLSDFLSNTIGFLCESMFVERGFIWVDVMGGKAAAYNYDESMVGTGAVRALGRFTGKNPVEIFGNPPSEEFPWVRAVAVLGQEGERRGLIALGGKRLGTFYADEDREFLATIADQATLTFENLMMEERLLESSQMESFNRFASFVIHDLKNTVGMLSLTAENAKENIKDEAFQHDLIDTVKRSMEKMQGLIDSLSAFRSTPTIRRERIDLAPLLRSWAEELERHAAAREVSLTVRAPGTLRLSIDRQAIKRVVENLVLNAVEATPAGGKVVLEASLAGGRAEIAVGDNGPGFDPEYLGAHLFSPFHSTKKGGLGIGLVLCKSLVEAHGGLMRIESEPGEGVRVTVQLPAADPRDGRE